MLKSRIIYLVLVIAVVCFFIFNGEYIAYAAVVTALSLPFFLYGIILLTSMNITASFGKCDSVVSKSEEAELEIVLKSSSFFSISSAKLYIESRSFFSGERLEEVIVLPINSKENTSIKTAIGSKYCGDTEITIKKLVLYDFFAITRHKKRINKSITVTVLPNICEILSKAEPSLSSDDESHSYSTVKSGDDSSQVFDYHEYREGDRMKNIHWKLSTKLDKLMVKEGSLPNSASVLVAFELNMPGKSNNKKMNMDIVDAAFDSLASISSWLSLNDIAYSIEWYSQKEQCNIGMRVESSNELYIALEQIYKIKPHSGNPVLYEIASKTTKAVSAQMLYITSILEQSTADTLARLSESIDVVICFIHDKGSGISENLARELEQQDITLIELSAEGISEALQNIAE